MKDNDPFYRDLLVDADSNPFVQMENFNILEILKEEGNIKTDESGAPVAKGATGGDDYWDTVNACAPIQQSMCEDADILKTGNANDQIIRRRPTLTLTAAILRMSLDKPSDKE